MPSRLFQIIVYVLVVSVYVGSYVISHVTTCTSGYHQANVYPVCAVEALAGHVGIVTVSHEWYYPLVNTAHVESKNVTR